MFETNVVYKSIYKRPKEVSKRFYDYEIYTCWA